MIARLKSLSHLTRRYGMAMAVIAVAAIGGEARAGFILSGNTHPGIGFSGGTNSAVVAFAVYQLSGGSYGVDPSGASAVNSVFGNTAQYLYLFSAFNDGGSVPITDNSVSILAANRITVGQLNAGSGLVFGNLYSPAGSATSVSPENVLNVNPTFAAGGTPIFSINTLPFSLDAQYAVGTWLPTGGTSVVWGYTSNLAPIVGTTGIIDHGTAATGSVPEASAVPEPSTVIMALMAVPAGLALYRRRRSARVASQLEA